MYHEHNTMGNEIVWKAMYMKAPSDEPIQTQLIYRTREEAKKGIIEEARGTVGNTILNNLEWKDREDESGYYGEYWNFIIKKKEIQEVDMEESKF